MTSPRKNFCPRTDQIILNSPTRRCDRTRHGRYNTRCRSRERARMHRTRAPGTRAMFPIQANGGYTYIAREVRSDGAAAIGARILRTAVRRSLRRCRCAACWPVCSTCSRELLHHRPSGHPTTHRPPLQCCCARCRRAMRGKQSTDIDPSSRRNLTKRVLFVFYDSVCR